MCVKVSWDVERSGKRSDSQARQGGIMAGAARCAGRAIVQQNQMTVHSIDEGRNLAGDNTFVPVLNYYG
jgi:hypothetical protein